MTIELRDDELADLGVEREELGDPAIMKLEQEIEQGYAARDFTPEGGRTVKEYILNYLGEHAFDPAVADKWAKAAGLEFRFQHDNPEVAILEDVRGDLQKIDILGDDEPSALFAAEDFSLALVDFDRAGAIAVHLRGDDRLVFRKSGDELATWRLTTEVAEPETPDEVRAPVDVWIEETSPDDWLVDSLESYLEVDSTWTHAVAAGTFDRLHRDRDEAHERLQSILDAEMETPTSRLQTWLAKLEASELKAISEAFVLEVDQVHDRLEEIRETIDPDDSLWRNAYLSLLHERDDLASVRTLLLEADCGEGLDAQLQALDEQGWRLVRSSPAIPELHDDPRLRRASLRQPDAWWVFPVSDRDPDLETGDPTRFVPPHLRDSLDDEETS